VLDIPVWALALSGSWVRTYT